MYRFFLHSVNVFFAAGKKNNDVHRGQEVAVEQKNVVHRSQTTVYKKKNLRYIGVPGFMKRVMLKKQEQSLRYVICGAPLSDTQKFLDSLIFENKLPKIVF